MKKADIERMISLADDRYIDEIFQDKITGRRRNIFVTFTAVAAALAVFAGGISYLVSKAGNADKIVVDDPIVSEVGVVDYSLYFQNKTGGVSDGYVSIRGYDDLTYVVTDKSVLDKSLPFDTEDIFSITTDVLCSSRNNDAPYAADIRFSYNDLSSVNITACKHGGLSNLNIENAVPVKLGDVDVYGFDLSENNSDICLEAYFVSNGTEYIVSGKNVSHNRLGGIIYEIINSGLSPESIDISNARLDYVYRSEDVSIEEANLLEPFAGCVPQPLDGFVLYRGVTCIYRDYGISSELYALSVTFADVPNLPNTVCNKNIQLYYSTEYKIADYCINIYDLTPAVIEPLFSGRNDSNGGKFTVDFGNFLVEIQAENCSTDEVWAYIEAIKSNMRGVEISLAEANKIEPYAGFVPQAEKVGDMKLGLVLYNGRNIALDYSFNSEKRFSYIGMDYTTDKDMASHYSIITVEQLKNGDIELHRSDSDDDRHNYALAVDCGGFYVCIDSQNCTTGELYDCILTLLMEKSGLAGDVNSSDFDFASFGTLAEANKLEPFAGYVPTAKEIGDLKIYTGKGNEVMSAETEEYGRVLNIAYQGKVTSGNVYGGYDFRAISTTYTEKKAYNIPEASIISVEKLPWANLDDFETDGIREGGRVCYRFIIDCGTCYISVAADCLPEEMKQFIREITGTALQDADDEDGKILTMDKVKELAKKGEDLTWSDFDGYTFTEGGSGLYIKSYAVEGGYNLMIGGEGRETKPMYIKLSDGNGKIIDIRYYSIDDFLNKKMLTMDKIKELAKKGDDLMWDDFDGYLFSEGGSGLCIRMYPVEGGYTLAIGGVPNDKPMYINLADNEKHIDIRYDSIDDFLNEN